MQSLGADEHTPPSCEKMPARLACTNGKSKAYDSFSFLVKDKHDCNKISIRSHAPRNFIITSVNMAEVPILIVKIPSNKLLGWWSLCKVLQTRSVKRSEPASFPYISTDCSSIVIEQKIKKETSGTTSETRHCRNILQLKPITAKLQGERSIPRVEKLSQQHAVVWRSHREC